MKRKALFLLLIVLLVFSGCEKENSDKTYKATIPSEKNNEEVDINKTDYFSDNEYVYNVDCFLEEDISEVTLKVAEVATYESGNVYNIRIDYGDCDGRYFWGVTDRFNLGMFYVVDENIYWISDTEEVPTEDDFEIDGIVIYDNEDSEDYINGEQITIENKGDTCRCVISNTLTESGFYSIFEWSEDMKLQYYASGYGAGGDLIELEL